MKTLLLGGRGQLASDIVRLWTRHDVVALGHDECDITDRVQVDAALDAHRPDVVLNTAAYHKVDDCEGTGAAAAFAVNVIGAKHVADACRERGAALGWISSDYVFSGTAGRPYREDDAPDPVSIYGISKAAGEHAIRYACERHYIVRSTGLYGIAGASGKGGNFVETMLRMAREGKPIRVVADQTMTPTSTHDLALALESLIETNAPGTYHLTNGGECTWHEFAATIFELTGVAAGLSPTTSAAFAAPARRPVYSVLANERAVAAGVPRLRPWRDALTAYLHAKGRRPPV